MDWIENLLIIAGVSLDIFAAMECQGSLVAKINKKNLTVICGIVALAQLITLYLGHFLSSLFCRYRSVPDEKLLGQIISMVIFMILGIRLMVKASATNMWKNIWNIILESGDLSAWHVSVEFTRCLRELHLDFWKRMCL